MECQKNCKSCLKSKPIGIDEHLLCTIKGIVTPDYVCKHYRQNLSSLLNVKSFRCKDCLYFKPTDFSCNGTFGTCRLFTERKFNGTSKRACSRILHDSSA